jgi:hypothetical protein
MAVSTLSRFKKVATVLNSLKKDSIQSGVNCFGYIVDEDGNVQEGDMSLLLDNTQLYFVAFTTDVSDFSIYFDYDEAIGIFPIQKVCLVNSEKTLRAVKTANFIQSVFSLGFGSQVKELIKWKNASGVEFHSSRITNDGEYQYHSLSC